MPEFAAGTERITLNLAKSAQRDGHSVEVVTCSLRGPSLWLGVGKDGVRFASVEGIPVYGMPGDHMETLAQLGIGNQGSMGTIFARFLDGKAPYDLVHLTHPMRMVATIETIRARRIPYIVTLTDFFFLCHQINLVKLSGEPCPGPAGGENCKLHCPLTSGATPNARLRRLKTILHEASEVVACSTFVSEKFKKELQSLPLQVIEHGIDLLHFGRPPTKDKHEEVVFGYLGTMSEAKGVTVLAEAFLSATPANARLELIGPSDGNEQIMERLGAIAKNDKRIQIKPAVPAGEVPQSLQRFDVLCLPSLVPETFSLALHEGFAAGLPCLVSDLGYPAEIVRRNRCGEVLAPGEIRAWTDAITRLATDPLLLWDWKGNLPLPARVEEEGFLYSCLYKAATVNGRSGP